MILMAPIKFFNVNQRNLQTNQVVIWLNVRMYERMASLHPIKKRYNFETFLNNSFKFYLDKLKANIFVVFKLQVCNLSNIWEINSQWTWTQGQFITDIDFIVKNEFFFVLYTIP